MSPALLASLLLAPALRVDCSHGGDLVHVLRSQPQPVVLEIAGTCTGPIEIVRDAGIEFAKGNRIIYRYHRQRLLDRFGQKRRTPHQQVIKNGAQGINIAARSDLVDPAARGRLRRQLFKRRHALCRRPELPRGVARGDRARATARTQL